MKTSEKIQEARPGQAIVECRKLESSSTSLNVEEMENQVKNLMANLTNLCGTDLGDETEAYILIYEFTESINQSSSRERALTGVIDDMLAQLDSTGFMKGDTLLKARKLTGNI